jgi:hypothetical protein
MCLAREGGRGWGWGGYLTPTFDCIIIMRPSYFKIRVYMYILGYIDRFA